MLSCFKISYYIEIARAQSSGTIGLKSSIMAPKESQTQTITTVRQSSSNNQSPEGDMKEVQIQSRPTIKDVNDLPISQQNSKESIAEKPEENKQEESKENSESKPTLNNAALGGTVSEVTNQN